MHRRDIIITSLYTYETKFRSVTWLVSNSIGDGKVAAGSALDAPLFGLPHLHLNALSTGTDKQTHFASACKLLTQATFWVRMPAHTKKSTTVDLGLITTLIKRVWLNFVLHILHLSLSLARSTRILFQHLCVALVIQLATTKSTNYCSPRCSKCPSSPSNEIQGFGTIRLGLKQ